MDQFVSVLSLMSAFVLAILLFSSSFKNCDDTWKSFFSMVFFYIAYDLMFFLGSLSDNRILLSFTTFTAVCCAILALLEFHFYLVCFFRDKKMMEIPDTTKYMGVLGICFLVVWTLYNLFFERKVGYIPRLIDIILSITRLLMVVPDFICIFKRRKALGTKISVFWCIHLVLPSLVNVIDAECGTESSFFFLTISILLIYITINQETELSIIQQKIDLEKKEKELQIVRRHVMISQIQPHFIYNVLNIICILCRRDPKEAGRTTRLFARYLKMNVDSLKKDKPIPFREELSHAKNYLKLEKIRFRDELEISYDIGPSNFCLPALSLQPMVENAVKHGLCMKEEGVGHLNISTKEDGTNWYVIVSDDGVGYDTKNMTKDDGRSHIGVENTKMRIEMMCHGSMDSFSIPGKGTNVVMTIPKLYDSNCLKENRVWDKEDDL